MASPAAPPHSLPRPVRWLLVAALAVHLAAGLARQPELAGFALALWRLDLVPRGLLAADERRNPQAAIGQIELRRQVAAALARGDRRPSAVASTWGWFVAHRGEVPAGARVFLASPLAIPYYYGNFLWAPSRLEVHPEPRLIRGEASLAAAAFELAAGESGRAALAARGYRLMVRLTPRGYELVRLAGE